MSLMCPKCFERYDTTAHFCKEVPLTDKPKKTEFQSAIDKCVEKYKPSDGELWMFKLGFATCRDAEFNPVHEVRQSPAAGDRKAEISAKAESEAAEQYPLAGTYRPSYAFGFEDGAQWADSNPASPAEPGSGGED